MQTYVRMLRRLVRESRYAVDERALAEAILTRARIRVAADRAELQKHLACLEQKIKQFHSNNGGSTAGTSARSVRRATARRASKRRATARSRQGDPDASIIEFLAQHAESTAGDLAKGLNLNPGSVSTRLTQLVKAGEIEKASRGYSIKQPDAAHG